MLCGNRKETVDHMINEYSELASNEHKTCHDLVGKVIQREFRKRLKFDYANKGGMHKTENETLKILLKNKRIIQSWIEDLT